MARDRKRDWGVTVAIGIEFQFCKRRRVLDMDGSDGCTATRMYLIPLNCTLKMVVRVNFTFYVDYHSFLTEEKY